MAGKSVKILWNNPISLARYYRCSVCAYSPLPGTDKCICWAKSISTQIALSIVTGLLLDSEPFGHATGTFPADIPASKVGNQWRFDREEIDQ